MKKTVFIPGLVSVSFRGLSPEQIIEITQNTGLEAIEWGGDVHVPAGRRDVAERVREMTQAAKIKMPEYGSYYRLGDEDENAIRGVIACARALGTKTVRVWAGKNNAAGLTREEYKRVVNDAKRICAMAPELTFCTECHNGTLTEDWLDALVFLHEVGCANFATFWQPNQFRTHEENRKACKALAPFVRAVHVFAWEAADGNVTRYPLSDHAERWRDYLDILKEAPVDELPLMLEFMHDDRPESLPAAAETLREFLTERQ